MNTLVDEKCPCVTVLIPVLNGEKFIENSLRSIVGQKHVHEVIVVDNGSTDNTLMLIQNFSSQFDGVKIIVERRPGIVNALNAGLRECKSTYLARLDADDQMKPTRIEKQVDFMKFKLDAVVVGTQIDFVNEAGEFLSTSRYPISNSKIRFQLSYKNPIAHPSTMLRIDKLRLLGGYNKAFEGAEDLSLWCDLMSHGSLYNLQESLTSYRIHKDQATKKSGPYLAELKFRSQTKVFQKSKNAYLLIGALLNELKSFALKNLRLYLIIKSFLRMSQ